LNNIPIPEKKALFMTVVGQSVSQEEFQEKFSGAEIFFEQSLDYHTETMHENVPADLFAEICMDIISDVFKQEDVQQIPRLVFSERVPLYTQLNGKANWIAKYSNPTYGNSEFQNIAEAVLEGTLYNLLQEVNAGEFDWTKYPMLIQQKQN
jgi:hypothetical protein